MDNTAISQSGFTLIEISITLVIIGLIVGGILTGRDLMDSAAQRAQITQIERYNTAVRTFQTKYSNYLPGDIPDPYATQFGFQPRGIYPGEGDGNGIIAGITGSGCSGSGVCDNGNMEAAGETAMFWVDLSTAKLLDGGFNTASPNSTPGADITGTAINNYLPQAKVGHSNNVYVWAGGYYSSQWNYSGVNYYSISVVTNIAAVSDYSKIVSTPGLTVQQAYSIDKKIDDGYPQSGRLTAMYLGGPVGNPIWTDGSSTFPPTNPATSPSSTTCYDNGNVNGATQKYSLSQNNGNNLNCALSVQFQ